MENSKFVNVLNQVAYKINSYKYIIAIKNSFTLLLPIIITGAFATLFSNMVFDSTNGLAQISWLSWLETLKPLSQMVNYATMDMMALLAVFLIGNEMAKLNNLNGHFPGLLAAVSYIAVIPTTIEVLVEGAGNVSVADVVSSSYTGSSGLFLGMIVAIGSIELFTWLGKREVLNIKMPDSVPTNVARSFSALLPTLITIIAIAAIGFAINMVTGVHIYDIIYNVVQGPLESLVQGLPGILLLMLVAQLFWVIGIHGNQIIKPIREPILLAAIAENTSALEAGREIPNIISMPFWDMYMSMGGSGMTIGLLIALFIGSRRDDYRSIGKLATPPGLFNVNEPVIFGMPIMLNPIMAIPFVITPLITGVIGYFATVIGFAGRAVVMIPWTTPPLLSGWLATAGSWGAVVTQVVCIAVSVLVYLPFVRIANKEASVQEIEKEEFGEEVIGEPNMENQ
ncbi:PTS sugar transporter subunit IIC [Marinilactibacillus piezotolerans]|uniref:PTS sugar transporter subunit IIC n=1 Tax=Marinilactibacillus piezotolerans TaxID=258723 RepID=UPI0009B0BBAE|nr:PTS transporter subunit EIIC [Marinilactibacillus piezotolerans]